MYAFAVKNNGANPFLSYKFGQSEYFAFYNGITLTIEKNHCQNSFEVVQWLHQKKVSSIISYDMGKIPYKKAHEYCIMTFYSGHKEICTSDMIDIIDKDLLEVYSNERVKQIFDKHQKKINALKK